jgi:dipeptidyl aminopeptidase/acylaminoacyl peptidase
MKKLLLGLAALLAAAPCCSSLADVLPAGPATGSSTPLTLEKIMADPDWIGPPVSSPFWSVDGKSVYYQLKRGGSPLSDLHRVALGSGDDKVIADADLAVVDAAAVFDAAARRAAFVRNGDLFVRDVRTGRLTQITRGAQEKSAPQFSADGRLLSFRAGNDWQVHDFDSGLTLPAAQLLAEKDPDAAPEADDLRDFQLRTFSTLKRMHDDAETVKLRARTLRGVDASRAAAPFYLGSDVLIRGSYLSPDARWLLVVTSPKAADKGREGKLTRYVTESGYEEFETERLRVGRNPPAPQSLLLLDLVGHVVHPLSYETLPGIHDDPLKNVRAENAAEPASTAASRAAPASRTVFTVPEEPDGTSGGGAAWSADSRHLAVQLFAIDNKDRWIASVDLATHALRAEHRLSDAAWINWSFNEFGWMLDNRTLWYQSEESGFVHLYAKPPDGAARPLTQGRFEVTAPVLSADGRWFYALSNAEAPYAYDVYRVASGGGELRRLTHLQGVEHFWLQPQGKQLLITHSSPYLRPQLAVLDAGGAGAVRELTDTRSAAYRAMRFVDPQIVQVPSTHFNGSIYAKVYGAAADAAAGARPAVMFVHGAGYLQDVHLRYSYYFREQMFNALLVQHGYVVIDVDYRASAGYGRDWRTAIYRQMGHPELEDMLDAKTWLVRNAHVDPRRVGVYGGSYGGFMTLMALFRAPGEFAAGAALRPVTDWMQYDHNYTSAILNDPQIDPISYRRSSPLEFAAALADPLLICHGVIDDNVLFEDSMRLYERLIELHKDNFTLSPYPLDRHGFVNADSWLDEYKRIYRLFQATLEQPRGS